MNEFSSGKLKIIEYDGNIRIYFYLATIFKTILDLKKNSVILYIWFSLVGLKKKLRKQEKASVILFLFTRTFRINLISNVFALSRYRKHHSHYDVTNGTVFQTGSL